MLEESFPGKEFVLRATGLLRSRLREAKQRVHFLISTGLISRCLGLAKSTVPILCEICDERTYGRTLSHCSLLPRVYIIVRTLPREKYMKINRVT